MVYAYAGRNTTRLVVNNSIKIQAYFNHSFSHFKIINNKFYNTCINDTDKWYKLVKRSYYERPEDRNFLTPLVGHQPSQDEALSFNAGGLGLSVLLRTSSDTIIANNTFRLYPKGIILHPYDWLKEGMINNTIYGNTYWLAGEKAQAFIKQANDEGLKPNSFYSAYWDTTVDTPIIENNRFCSNNQWQYPSITGMTYSDSNHRGQIKDATCELPILN